MKQRKGCWTCAARKIQCDGGQPGCRKCARARKACQGYGVRLSWPQVGDRKRAIIGNDDLASRWPGNQKISDVFFINTTWKDLNLFRELPLRIQHCHSAPLPGDPLKLHDQDVSHVELMHHFETSAYLSLATFEETKQQIRDKLISLVWGQNTVSGLALLCAILAFSSLHRQGIDQQAVDLKLCALRFLSTSVGDESLHPEKTAQLVGASMLLAAFETLLPPQSPEWVWHVWGAMDIVQASLAKNNASEYDIDLLRGWVYYHDALARFAVHHWRDKPLAMSARNSKARNFQYSGITKYRPVPPPPNPTHAIMYMLSEACGTLLDPTDPQSHTPAYHDRVKFLEGKIERSPTGPNSGWSIANPSLAVQLHDLATRVYFARASQSLGISLSSLDSAIDEAITETALRCNSCEHMFPLFILACEARADELRTAILGLIDRSSRNVRVGNIQWVKNAILSVWVHRDLHADSDLLVNYVGIVSEVISASNSVPSIL